MIADEEKELNAKGAQFVIPVQAKGGADQLGSVQAAQDLACCAEKFPRLQCRSVSTQFVDRDLIAMFELVVETGSLRIVEERHYRLVPANEIGADDLARYAG